MYTNKEKRKMRDRITEINLRFEEMANAVETERRALTDGEKEERAALIQEKEILQLRLERSEHNPASPQDGQELTRELAFENLIVGIQDRNIPEEFRGMVQDGKTIILRAGTVQDTSTVGAITPLTIGDIIKPLEKGLILNQVGCSMQYGMDGAWQFPSVAGVEATVTGEDVEISDSKIDINKIAPNPRRVSISVPITWQAQNRSGGSLFGLVTEQISMSLTRVLNRWMFSRNALSGTDGGCFVNPTTKNTYQGEITWRDAIRLRGSVMKTGVVFDGTPAYVCSASTYADLESTPRDAGSGLMVIENGRLNGFPVFITEYFGDDALGFGVFSYMLVGQFGTMRLTVDPYTQSKRDRIVFTLNTDFDMLPLRTEAFGVLTKATPTT